MKDLVLVFDFMTEGVFDRWVIGFDEMALAVLYCERRLAWTAKGPLSASEQGRMQYRGLCSPTDRLPTIAILRCLFTAGMIALGVPEELNELTKADLPRRNRGSDERERAPKEAEDSGVNEELV